METSKIIAVVACVLVIVVFLVRWFADLFTDYSSELESEMSPFNYVGNCQNCRKEISFSGYGDEHLFCSKVCAENFSLRESCCDKP